VDKGDERRPLRPRLIFGATRFAGLKIPAKRGRILDARRGRLEGIMTSYQCAATFLGLDVAANPGQVHGVVNLRGGCVNRRDYLRRALLVLLALAFLFETWIWDRVVAAAQRLATLINWAAIRAALRRVIERLPVGVALLLFGIPFVVAEGGAFVCVLFAAMGHVVAGAIGYTAIKIVGFGLLAPIFDLTKPKLMTLPWFAFVYDKAVVFHHFALGLIAPYRAAAQKLASEFFVRVRALWARRREGANEEAR
jgi:hypothetical protein